MIYQKNPDTLLKQIDDWEQNLEENHENLNAFLGNLAEIEDLQQKELLNQKIQDILDQINNQLNQYQVQKEKIQEGIVDFNDLIQEQKYFIQEYNNILSLIQEVLEISNQLKIQVPQVRSAYKSQVPNSNNKNKNNILSENKKRHNQNQLRSEKQFNSNNENFNYLLEYDDFITQQDQVDDKTQNKKFNSNRKSYSLQKRKQSQNSQHFTNDNINTNLRRNQVYQSQDNIYKNQSQAQVQFQQKFDGNFEKLKDQYRQLNYMNEQIGVKNNNKYPFQYHTSTFQLEKPLEECGFVKDTFAFLQTKNEVKQQIKQINQKKEKDQSIAKSQSRMQIKQQKKFNSQLKSQVNKEWIQNLMQQYSNNDNDHFSYIQNSNRQKKQNLNVQGKVKLRYNSSQGNYIQQNNNQNQINQQNQNSYLNGPNQGQNVIQIQDQKYRSNSLDHNNVQYIENFNQNYQIPTQNGQNYEQQQQKQQSQQQYQLDGQQIQQQLQQQYYYTNNTDDSQAVIKRYGSIPDQDKSFYQKEKQYYKQQIEQDVMTLDKQLDILREQLDLVQMTNNTNNNTLQNQGNNNNFNNNINNENSNNNGKQVMSVIEKELNQIYEESMKVQAQLNVHQEGLHKKQKDNLFNLKSEKENLELMVENLQITLEKQKNEYNEAEVQLRKQIDISAQIQQDEVYLSNLVSWENPVFIQSDNKNFHEIKNKSNINFRYENNQRQIRKKNKSENYSDSQQYQNFEDDFVIDNQDFEEEENDQKQQSQFLRKNKNVQDFKLSKSQDNLNDNYKSLYTYMSNDEVQNGFQEYSENDILNNFKLKNNFCRTSISFKDLRKSNHVKSLQLNQQEKSRDAHFNSLQLNQFLPASKFSQLHKYQEEKKKNLGNFQSNQCSFRKKEPNYQKLRKNSDDIYFVKVKRQQEQHQQQFQQQLQKSQANFSEKNQNLNTNSTCQYNSSNNSHYSTQATWKTSKNKFFDNYCTNFLKTNTSNFTQENLNQNQNDLKVKKNIHNFYSKSVLDKGLKNQQKRNDYVKKNYQLKGNTEEDNQKFDKNCKNGGSEHFLYEKNQKIQENFGNQKVNYNINQNKNQAEIFEYKKENAMMKNQAIVKGLQKQVFRKLVTGQDQASDFFKSLKNISLHQIRNLPEKEKQQVQDFFDQETFDQNYVEDNYSQNVQNFLNLNQNQKSCGFQDKFNYNFLKVNSEIKVEKNLDQQFLQAIRDGYLYYRKLCRENANYLVNFDQNQLEQNHQKVQFGYEKFHKQIEDIQKERDENFRLQRQKEQDKWREKLNNKKFQGRNFKILKNAVQNRKNDLSLIKQQNEKEIDFMFFELKNSNKQKIRLIDVKENNKLILDKIKGNFSDFPLSKVQKQLYQEIKEQNFTNIKYMMLFYEELIQQKDDKGNTPLHVACKYCDQVDIIEYLVGLGGQFRQKNDVGRTAFDIAKTLKKQNIIDYFEEKENLEKGRQIWGKLANK
ncbi:Ankyrin repeat-containing domain [Pseudocohnilembus persalinus]|uniref:Ankyrin repeat-containing domain n=1 Tax=Pseudocohnilembus persalinus TaxID=266149 RepID=A0A0V0R7R3_PSEPJ|nr:Ankyrin repeat-containing domain [Pseudocohnilembus persalinus]|eukprot:KRX10543.1 Ankyrin repeat-containing domain [Pseudocohnilembus persalinus]